MTSEVQNWVPAILALFGSLLVVVFTPWLNTGALSTHIDAVDKKLNANQWGVATLERRSRHRGIDVVDPVRCGIPSSGRSPQRDRWL